MHSERVLKALKKAGWYEGRCIDIKPYMTILSKLYHSIPDVVKDVLREYGGLVIETAIPDKNYNELDLTQVLTYIPDIPYYSGDATFEPRVNSDLILIGEIWSGFYLLYMTPNGIVYGNNGESILFLGSTFDEMLENVCTPNYKAKEMPL